MHEIKHVYMWINFYLPTSLLYLAKFFIFLVLGPHMLYLYTALAGKLV